MPPNAAAASAVAMKNLSWLVPLTPLPPNVKVAATEPLAL